VTLEDVTVAVKVTG